MTAPFAPPIPWEVKAIMLGMFAVVVAIPFGRRGDWVGWIALMTMYLVMVGFWALLIRGWWQSRSRSE